MRTPIAIFAGISAVLLPELSLAETIVFQHANVVPMTEETVLSDQAVAIEDGKIIAVTPSSNYDVPENATIIDAQGKYLLPGLAEMHSHIPPVDSPNLAFVMDLFMANGVTAVRGMIGRPGHPALRDMINAGEIVAPRLLVAGSSLNGNSVSSVEDGVRQVREQRAARFDHLKMHPGLTMEEFLAIAKTARELGIPLTGHIPPTVGLKVALDNGIRSVEHLDGYAAYLAFGSTLIEDTSMAGERLGEFSVKLAPLADDARIPEIVAFTLQSGAWNSPTELLVENLLGDEVGVEEMAAWPDLQYVPKETREAWLKEIAEVRAKTPRDAANRLIRLRRELLRQLRAAGAGILLSSDAPQIMNVPGFSLHRELALLVDAGFTPFEALETGTTAAAKFSGFNTGAVEVGREADLILLQANPLENIHNTTKIDGVMLRGKWFGRDELDAILNERRVTE